MTSKATDDKKEEHHNLSDAARELKKGSTEAAKEMGHFGGQATKKDYHKDD